MNLGIKLILPMIIIGGIYWFTNMKTRSAIESVHSDLMQTEIMNVQNQILTQLASNLANQKLSSKEVETLKSVFEKNMSGLLETGEVFKNSRKNYQESSRIPLLREEFKKKLLELDGVWKKVRNHSNPDWSELQIRFQEISESLYEKADLNRSQISSSMNTGLLLSFAIILVTLILQHLHIKKPINEMFQVLRSVVQGDFSKECSYSSSDELGQLCRDINSIPVLLTNLSKEMETVYEEVFRGNLQIRIDSEVYQGEFTKFPMSVNSLVEHLSSIIGILVEQICKLQDSANVLEESSKTMVEVASNNQNSSEEGSNSIDELVEYNTSIAATAEQISLNISSISGAAEEMSVNMNAISSTTQELSEAIENIKASSESAKHVSETGRTLASEASVTMNQLGESASEIGKVTDVIKRIAEKTNLLALNATIEAASAGEAGRGFAVVAHEIKDLANQSAKAAEEIAGKIQGMQTSSTSALEAMNTVNQTIMNIDEVMEMILQAVVIQVNSSHQISRNVSEAAAGANSVACSISELASGANDMSNNVGLVSKRSLIASNIMAQVSSTSELSMKQAADLSTTSNELRDITSKFRDVIQKFVDKEQED